MATLTTTLVVIFTAITVLPTLARRTGVPVIVLELLLGIAVGVSWLDIVPTSDHLITFFAEFGLVYLMFLAGMEMNLEAVRTHLRRTVAIAAVSIGVPFGVGFAVAPYIGLSPALTGIIFSTTSISLVLPLTQEMDYDQEVLDILLGSVALVDITSLFLLGFVLTIIQGNVQAEFFYGATALLTLFVIPFLVSRPRVSSWLQEFFFEEEHFNDTIRFSFALILVLGAVVDRFGFHSIIGSFIAGLVIAEVTPQTSRLERRLESFGYGFFIPLFFVITGAQVDVPALLSDTSNVTVLVVIVTTALLAKFLAVTAITRWGGLSWPESTAFGCFHSARVSLIIAAVTIALDMGLIGETVFSSFVILAMVSALVGPSSGKLVLQRASRKGLEAAGNL